MFIFIHLCGCVLFFCQKNSALICCMFVVTSTSMFGSDTGEWFNIHVPEVRYAIVNHHSVSHHGLFRKKAFIWHYSNVYPSCVSDSVSCKPSLRSRWYQLGMVLKLSDRVSGLISKNTLWRCRPTQPPQPDRGKIPESNSGQNNHYLCWRHLVKYWPLFKVTLDTLVIRYELLTR